MKKQLSIILSILSVCSLLSASIEASDFDGTLQEKGSKAKSKAKITMSGSSCCQGKPGNQGATGPTGATGPAGATGSLSSVYATLAQEGASEEFSYQEGAVVTVPLNEMDPETAKGVIFSAANNTFTLPKGLYTIHFEFTINTPYADGAASLRFTNIYLDLNGDSSRIPLSWVLSLMGEAENLHFNVSENFNEWGCVSGSKLFKISQDDTVVKLMIEYDAENYYKTTFEFPNIPVESLDNKAVRITLHKISDL